MLVLLPPVKRWLQPNARRTFRVVPGAIFVSIACNIRVNQLIRA
jgi:hypothetical protein